GGRRAGDLDPDRRPRRLAAGRLAEAARHHHGGGRRLHRDWPLDAGAWMNVLALNCGSSSVKFRLLAVDPDADVTQARALAGGLLDRLGPTAHSTFEADGRAERSEGPVADHADAVDRLLRWLAAGAVRIDAVGHRVVHGGGRFVTPTAIDDTVIREIEEL